MNVKISNAQNRIFFNDLEVEESFMVIGDKYDGDACIKTQDVYICARILNAFDLSKNKLVFIPHDTPVKKITDLKLTAVMSL